VIASLNQRMPLRPDFVRLHRGRRASTNLALAFTTLFAGAAAAAPPDVPPLRIAPAAAANAFLLATVAPTNPPALTNFTLESTDPQALPILWSPAAADATNGAGFTVSQGASQQLFRLRLADPWLATLDADGDGLNDLYERQNPQFLNPFDPTDAAKDWDRDGVSNLDEFLRGADPDEFTGQLAVTADHRTAIKRGGALWSWSAGSPETAPAPSAPGAWKSVASAGMAPSAFTLAVTVTGELWAWGDNAAGQLGDGSTVAHPDPVRVGGDSDWVLVAACAPETGPVSAAMKADGSLWTWGATTFSFTSPTTIATTPHSIGTETPWRIVAAGADYFLGLRTDGSLWEWGAGFGGAFGAFSPTDQPRRVGSDTDWRHVIPGGPVSLAIRTDGSLWGWGQWPPQLHPTATTNPIPVETRWRWRTAAALQSGVVGVRSDGALWAWGALPDAGGGVTDFPEPVAVAPGARWEMLAIENLGVVGPPHLAFGRRDDGSLWRIAPGDAVPQPHLRPWRVGVDADWTSAGSGRGWSMALKTSGALWTWGQSPYAPSNAPSRPYAQLTQITPGTAWSQASAWFLRGYAVDASGALWHIGYPLRYDVGSGSGNPGTIGGGCEHCTGGGSGGPSQSPPPAWTPERVDAPGAWRKVVQGADHAAGVQTNGTLWVWGLFPRPAVETVQTRAAANTPVQVGAEADWRDVEAGDNHCLALTTRGALFALGYNDAGQLGDGSTSARETPTAIRPDLAWVSIAAGAHHSLAVAADGSLWAWGGGARGQLGLAGLTNALAPVRIGSSSAWTAVFASGDTSFAVASDGALWSWGANETGQLGVGDTADHPVPVRVEGLADVALVAPGGTHTVAVRRNGSLWAWGSPQTGAVPDAGLNLPLTQIGAASDW
jgi:alpha-tubulin suppressor-like RCC1 family protein